MEQVVFDITEQMTTAEIVASKRIDVIINVASHNSSSTKSGVPLYNVRHLAFKSIPIFLLKEIPIVYFSFGIMFNLLLIYYFVKSGRWKSPMFTLITSLAVSDLLTCFTIIGWSAFLYPVMPFPDAGWTCTFFMSTGLIGVIASLDHLVFFAALRFYQLGYPLAARSRITCKFVLKGCIIIWIIVLLYLTPVGILFVPEKVIIDNEINTVCEFGGDVNIMNICFTLFHTTLPTIAIITLHIGKYVMISRSKKNLDMQQQGMKNVDARAVGIVIVLFFIAWIPANVYSVIQQLRLEVHYQFQDYLYNVLFYVLYSNSALNPIIYCLAAKTVRTDATAFLCPSMTTSNSIIAK